MLHAIIMAGGSGTRFWPESRAARPKQLLTLAGPRTLLQSTVDRLQGLVPPERILIVTSARLAPLVAEQLPQLSPAAILGEPCRRDTAPCIGLAALYVAQRDPQATMLVLPADHVIQPDAALQAAVRQAAALVDASPGRIVTFGIPPTYPAETFGYIERGEPLAAPVADDAPSYHVRRFREKPKGDLARQFVDAGNFYWNSGIFVWRAATILDALALRQPPMHARLTAIAAAFGRPDFPAIFEREFAAIAGVSIDYAVMEHAADVAVIEAPFQWDDLGSWQALARLRGTDEAGNTVDARHLGLDTMGAIIRGPDDHLIVTLGVRDLIVVHTPDVTLVANKHDEESIRKLVKELDDRGWIGYL
jgi:mannose-1-phosphate guanylyltransferase